MRKFKRKLFKVIIEFISICILIVVLFIGGFILYVSKFVKPYDINLNQAKLALTGANTSDGTGGNQQYMNTLIGEQNRIWVSLSDVPKNLTNAIVSTEDKDFYTNSGVDYRRTLESAANAVFHFYKFNEGGSTITQQDVKNLEGNINDRTYQIKLKEIATALKTDKEYSKDQIIEIYINVVTMGKYCYGVQAASHMYFGTDVKNLDLAQCATLACILPAPNGQYNPYSHPQNVQNRRGLVLKNMLNQGMINKSEYNAAIQETVTFLPQKAG